MVCFSFPNENDSAMKIYIYMIVIFLNKGAPPACYWSCYMVMECLMIVDKRAGKLFEWKALYSVDLFTVGERSYIYT